MAYFGIMVLTSLSFCSLENDLALLEHNLTSIAGALPQQQNLGRALLTMPDSVGALALNSSETLLAVGDYRGHLTFFDMHERTIKTSIEFPLSIRSMDFHPSKPLLAVGTNQQRSNLFIINVDDTIGSSRHSLDGHRDSITCVTFNHAGTLLASASDDRTVKIWDPITNKLLFTLQDPETKKPFHYYLLTVSFNSDDTLLVVAGAQSLISVWDMTTKPEPKLILTKVMAPPTEGYNFSSAAFHPKKPSIFAYATDVDNRLEIFDISRKTTIKTFKKSGLGRDLVTWHPSGNYLLTRNMAIYSGGVIVWNTENDNISQLIIPEDTPPQPQFCNIVVGTSFPYIISGFRAHENKGVVYAWDDPTILH